jgi:chaperonin GroES
MEFYTMKIKPLNDRILVQRIEQEKKTAGGIIIPDNAQEKPLQGKVLAVGEGKLLENGTRGTLQVKEGDVILFGKYAGSEIKLGDEDHLILREDDILGIIL